MSEQKYNLSISLVNSLGESYDISPENVISLSITESVLSLLPRFEMEISDKGSFLDDRAITDKSMFYIVIDNIIESEPIIDANFIISSFVANSDSLENQFNSFIITGYVECFDMFSPYLKRAYKGSSDTVISNIANEMGMTFDGRVVGVENNTWYQNGNNYQFIHHVGDRSFIDGDGVFVYGDVNRNIVYTSYDTEASRESTLIGYYSKDRVENNVLMGDDKKYMYFNAYNVMNNVDMYNNCVLYGGSYSYYNLEEYIYTDIELDSKLTDFYNQHQDYSDTSVFSIGVGLLPDEPIFDTIYKGKVQNAFYKYALFSNTILVNINNSTQVKLFDKIDFNLPSPFTRDGISDPYSGEYLIGSITYSIARNRPLEKQVILCRHGINNNPDDKSVKDIV